MSISSDHTHRGFTLLYSLVVIATLVLLFSTTARLMVREIQISNLKAASQLAYYAAQTGMECAVYAVTETDLSSIPLGGSSVPISCGGGTITVPSAGGISSTWYNIAGGGGILACVRVTIERNNAPTGGVIRSYGYSKGGSSAGCPNYGRTAQRAVQTLF